MVGLDCGPALGCDSQRGSDGFTKVLSSLERVQTTACRRAQRRQAEYARLAATA
jgi:hypothetical protein